MTGSVVEILPKQSEVKWKSPADFGWVKKSDLVWQMPDGRYFLFEKGQQQVIAGFDFEWPL